jgi:hypothetical protein
MLLPWTPLLSFNQKVMWRAAVEVLWPPQYWLRAQLGPGGYRGNLIGRGYCPVGQEENIVLHRPSVRNAGDAHERCWPAVRRTGDRWLR